MIFNTEGECRVKTNQTLKKQQDNETFPNKATYLPQKDLLKEKSNTRNKTPYQLTYPQLIFCG